MACERKFTVIQIEGLLLPVIWKQIEISSLVLIFFYVVSQTDYGQ